ncbi:MAG: hypothetical protein LBQ31_06205, partial [Bacteroidales bacterium]|nr:hypothetical protein [Bacteroidales bacterium]
MKKSYILLILALVASISFAPAQTTDDPTSELAKADNLTQEQQEKMNAAFAALDLVQQAGNYIESLTELFQTKVIPLPVGIKSKEDGYELIVHKVYLDKKTGKPFIYATCAFRFRNTDQQIAFEGEAMLESVHGLGDVGRLALIAPVKRDIGKHSTLLVREGTGVAFSCNGIESFDAKLGWLITSDKITAVNADGTHTGKPLGVF